MQIDPRTMEQLIQLQTKNDIHFNGNSNEKIKSENDGALFDILLQELMIAEGDERSEATDMAGVFSMAGFGETYNGAMWQAFPGVVEEVLLVDSASWSTSASGIHGEYDQLVAQASRNYGVPESLIKAVIEVESSFNPNAVSSAGAKGLMQLMDGTANGLGVRDSFDPVQNIDGGTRYLSNQLKRFGGEVNTALAAYNAGPGKLQRLGITNDQQLMDKLHTLPRETQNYISKIAAARAKYEV